MAGKDKVLPFACDETGSTAYRWLLANEGTSFFGNHMSLPTLTHSSLCRSQLSKAAGKTAPKISGV